MHPTAVAAKLVTTQAGMRCILKKLPPVNKYMRLAVDAGIYRDRDDDGGADFLDVREGPDARYVEDYPIEYQIMMLHPPHPYHPPLPRYLQRRMEHARKPHETQTLMKKRFKTLTQQQQQQSAAQTKTARSMTEAEYYERLLGVPPPSAGSGVATKTAVVQQSYAFALKQWQIMRQDGVSEQESLDMVNALLDKEQTQEKQRARAMAKDLHTWRQSRNLQETAFQALPQGSMEKQRAEHALHKSTIPTIFSNKERTISAMAMWSQRLRSIPYFEWSIGAAVSLDHWVARSILDMSEESWQTLLEGTDPSLASRGTDIIHARQALFPETILQEEHYDNDDGGNDDKKFADQSIDELLAKLGMDDAGDDGDLSAWKTNDNVDRKVAQLVEQLQDWREKNAKVQYALWKEKDQQAFDDWIREYVASVTDGKSPVDYDATRKALLSQPPIRREQADGFWTAIQDETDAEIFLQNLHKDGMPRVSLLSELFYELPYQEQLQKLLDLGTLRPMLDEYTTESKRRQFMAQYGHLLMEGVMTDHLVADSNGPIYGRELGRWGENAGISSQERFRMEKIPYGSEKSSDESIERARMLLAAWNELKVGRARYEEYLFGKGKLGLTYNEDMTKEDDDNDDEDEE